MLMDSSLIISIFSFSLYHFAIIAMTNYYKLIGLKQHTFILLRF